MSKSTAAPTSSRQAKQAGARRQTTGMRVFQVVNGIVLVTFALICVLPFLNVLGSSFATPGELATRSFIIVPYEFTLDAYKYILSTSTIFRAMGVSLFVTIVGTFVSLLLTALMAYALSKRYLRGRRVINFLVVFTMLFSGGMIPTFIVVQSLGLIDSLWALILPVAINAFNFVIMRSFFQAIPDSLEEAARIDGCSDLGTFFRIVLPLSLASIATIGLFYAVGYWNTYQNAILYINDSTKWPIQVLLRQIVIVASGMNADASAVDVVPPAQSVKMAVIVVATLPMLLVYPFIQRYFVKGALIGSVKG
ncbi:carbohydrate ABC transporter permease [Isoptericola dokdonensis]|jgi:putative aldouronate transport system permease protein|uniref:L-arabinose transport system permease protein AraQ n=1 Tax=Isoptericola dokdonensis DS-3 TaxID=1300344 RepID=A0A168FX16_9MICO|nr:carbohydrate ABC transporter permease [Isoptericola dokdonensis]ANC32650.1 L-arabinose transport system permease protein AraQ [Isoptericola dokdonensis DS-3]